MDNQHWLNHFRLGAMSILFGVINAFQVALLLATETLEEARQNQSVTYPYAPMSV